MIKNLPYSTQSEQYIRLMENERFPVWIDSPNQDGFEIISCCPEKVLIEYANTAKDSDKTDLNQKNIELFNVRKNEYQSISGFSLDYLNDQLKCSQNNYTEIPFSGGWIGICSYEYGTQLVGLKNLSEQSKRLCKEDLVFAYYSWAIIIDHKKQQSYLYQENPQSNAVINKILDGNFLTEEKSQAPCKLLSPFINEITEQQYNVAFNKIQDYLLAGDCYQVNYAQRFKAQYKGSELNAYLTLRKQLRAPFSCYFKWFESSLLSFSPERFIRLEGEILTTEPIKGTSPRFESPIKDTQSKYHLKNSLKDQAENLMIVDLLRNDLSRISKKGSVVVDELFGLYSFSNVHHLISRIKSTIAENKTAVDIISACFPGGSITGAPKKRAMEIINELEQSPRDIYCGSMFVISNNGYVDSNILIRSLLLQDATIYCWAGGGIVSDSKAETEYQECFNKVNAIFEALNAL